MFVQKFVAFTIPAPGCSHSGSIYVRIGGSKIKFLFPIPPALAFGIFLQLWMLSVNLGRDRELVGNIPYASCLEGEERVILIVQMLFPSTLLQ